MKWYHLFRAIMKSTCEKEITCLVIQMYSICAIVHPNCSLQHNISIVIELILQHLSRYMWTVAIGFNNRMSHKQLIFVSSMCSHIHTPSTHCKIRHSLEHTVPSVGSHYCVITSYVMVHHGQQFQNTPIFLLLLFFLN